MQEDRANSLVLNTTGQILSWAKMGRAEASSLYFLFLTHQQAPENFLVVVVMLAPSSSRGGLRPCLKLQRQTAAEHGDTFNITWEGEADGALDLKTARTTQRHGLKNRLGLSRLSACQACMMSWGWWHRPVIPALGLE